MPGTPLLPLGTRALLLSALLALLTACASTPPTSNPNAQDTPGSTGSATPGGTTQPIPPATLPQPTPTAPDCTATPAPLTIHTGQQPTPVCLRVGQSLTITAPPSPTQPWQPVTTSDASVLTCTSRPLGEGALTATCHALAPGTATLSTTTAAFSGDPHGPAQFTWTLTVRIQTTQ